MTKSEAKYDLLEAGAEIIWRKGFNNTGIQEILKKAGIPKGSFYFYFNNKEDFGLELIDVFAGMIKTRLTAQLEKKDLSCKERLRAFFNGQNQIIEFQDFTTGCPIGNLAQEMSGLNEAFRNKLLDTVSELSEKVIACLDEGINSGEFDKSLDAAAFTDFMINSWEGAVIKAKLTRSAKPLKNFDTFVFEKLM